MIEATYKRVAFFLLLTNCSADDFPWQFSASRHKIQTEGCLYVWPLLAYQKEKGTAGAVRRAGPTGTFPAI